MVASIDEFRRQHVYLLHGFGGRPFFLKTIERLLLEEGFQVKNWGYPNVFRRIEQMSRLLRTEVERVKNTEPSAQIHFVTHSLGGIVARHAFSANPPEGIHRLVMLAPPNLGSHLARRTSKLFGRWCPVLRELSDEGGSFVNQVGIPGPLEVGIIAASRDWVVSRRCTHLPAENDYVVVSASHMSLPFKSISASYVLSFLKHGRFQPETRAVFTGRLTRQPPLGR